MNKVKNWLVGIIDYVFKKVHGFLVFFATLVPWLIVGVIILLLSKHVLRYGLTFDQFISFVEVVIWPTVIFTAIVLFKKIFTYLFFSLEEFSFFGAKGKLIDVRTMITNKADEMYQKKLEEEERSIERESLEKELNALKSSTEKESERTKRALEIAEKALDRNEVLLKDNAELRKIQTQLADQLKMYIPLNTDSSKRGEFFGDQEEARDVGQTEGVVVKEQQSN